MSFILLMCLLTYRIQESWSGLRTELILLQNLEKKQIDLKNHLSMSFKPQRTKEEYFEELQNKFNHADNATKRHNSIPEHEKGKDQYTQTTNDKLSDILDKK